MVRFIHAQSASGEYLIDSNGKIMAAREFDGAPWIRTTHVVRDKDTKEIFNIDQLKKTRKIGLLEIEGFLEGTYPEEYSSAPTVEESGILITETKEFGGQKVSYGGCRKMMEGDFHEVEESITQHGIEAVVDSMMPIEAALLIHHLKNKQEGLAYRAYAHFEKQVFVSHAITDDPKTYMQEFDRMIETNCH